MTKLIEIVKYLEQVAPLKLQESYDNSGLICGDIDKQISGAIISLDCIESVVDEAISKKCNLIVSHHPIIFKGLKTLSGNNYIERTVIKAIKNDIAIYAIHTNLDNVINKGVNEKIAHQLNLIDLKPLIPKTNDYPELNVGTGIIGSTQSAVNPEDYLRFIKDRMNTACIKHTKIINKPIESVAICGGSGSSFLTNARQQGADIFITADFKYHEFFDAENDIIIADIGHFESEQYTIDLLYEIITNKFSTFAAYCTEVNTNPVNYLL